jgi:co-chaperonin GroES (HSP10)
MTKYLEQFKKLEGSKYKLAGGRMLVEILPKKEMKTTGGLIMAAPLNHKGTADTQRAVVGVVLMTGEGYVDDDGIDVPMETKVGSVVVLNEFGLKYYSEFPGIATYTESKLALTAESEIQMKFDSFDDLAAFEKLLDL